MPTRTLSHPFPRGPAAMLAGKGWRIALLLATLAAAIAYAMSRPRLPQDPAYLLFVDGRGLLGVPRALDVLSNLAFAAVGAWGLALLRPGRLAWRDRRERWPWLVFFAGVALTSAGSAWFHLDPTLGRLVWDRLPMTLGFMGLLAALVAERIDAGAGLALLGPLVAVGLATVLYWHLSEQAGRGDLRPYLLVQYYPLAALPMLLLLFRAPYTGSAAYLAALVLYLAAKLAEAHDADVYALGGVVSGHTLKHLLAAGAIGAVAWMLARRAPRPE